MGRSRSLDFEAADTRLRRIIELQALLAEIVENFHFDLPKDGMVIDRPVARIVMFPVVRGKEDMGAAMPLRVSLAQ